MKKLKKYACIVCNFCSGEKDRVKRHFETHTKPQFTCQIRDISLQTRVLIAEYLKMEHSYYFDWWRKFVTIVCCSLKSKFIEYDVHL